jgi:hypothetical protein
MKIHFIIEGTVYYDLFRFNPNSSAKINAVSNALKAGLVIIIPGEFSFSPNLCAISFEILFPFSVRDLRSQRFQEPGPLLFHAG